MKQETIEQVRAVMTDMGRALLPYQYRIGSIMLAEVGNGLKPSGPRQGQQEGSINKLATELSEAMNDKTTGEGYSVAWYKQCYYIARNLTADDMLTISRHTPTQKWLYDLVHMPDAKRKATIESLKDTAGKKLVPESRPSVKRTHSHKVDPEIADQVVLSIHDTAEQLADKVAYIVRRERDAERRTVMVAEIRQAIERACK